MNDVSRAVWGPWSRWVSSQIDKVLLDENQPSLAPREVAREPQSCLLDYAQYSTDEKPLLASHAIVRARG
jgi:hypothetical protein